MPSRPGSGGPSSALTLARWRLRTQRLTAPHAPGAGAVLDHLLAVQSENPPRTAWAVASRTVDRDPADLEALLASGEVVRTHVLRPTWHYVGRRDVDRLLALTGPSIRTVPLRMLTQDLGVPADDVDLLVGALLDLVEASPARTRAEIDDGLAARLPGLALGLPGPVLGNLLQLAEADRLVVGGPPRGGEHTWSTWSQVVGERLPVERVDRQDLLAWTARRYAAGHGPATAGDLAYWATLRPAEAREALEGAGLQRVDVDGRRCWHLEDPPDDAPAVPRAHLLQVLDETYRGYQDSRWVLDARGSVPRGRERSLGMVLLDGQLVASWRDRRTATMSRFEVSPHRSLPRGGRAAVEEAAERYAVFLGRAAEVVLTTG